MPTNLEVKARIDRHELAEEILRSSGAEYAGIHEQVDTYFNTRGGRLKIREIDGREAELIYYERAEGGRERISQFERIPCGDPDTLRSVLARSLGVRGVVRKKRKLFMIGPTRVHLDEVEGLGFFVELETPVESTSERARSMNASIIEKLGIRETDSIEGSYIDLIA